MQNGEHPGFALYTQVVDGFFHSSYALHIHVCCTNSFHSCRPLDRSTASRIDDDYEPVHSSEILYRYELFYVFRSLSTVLSINFVVSCYVNYACIFLWMSLLLLSTIVLYCEVKVSPTRTSNEGI